MKQIWLTLDSSATGGIETHVFTLAKLLHRRGYPVAVRFVADHGRHPLEGKLAAENIPYSKSTNTRAFLADFWSAPPELVHSHGYKAGILCRMAAFLKGIPAVHTFHAGEPGTGMVKLYTALDRWTSFLSRRIAVSRSVAESQPFPPRVIANFVAPSRAGPNRMRPTIAFVGRLSAEKGPDIFCEIARALPEYRFEIFGDGPMRSELEQRHGDHVVFHGNVEDMEERWQDIGLLCMPSRHEGLPMAALEAMNEGVPVAAFAVGGLPDLICDRETGYLARPGNQSELINAIRHHLALDLEERNLISDSARQSIQESFDPDEAVNEILTEYQLAGDLEDAFYATA